MAAVQDSDAIAPDAHARRQTPRVVPVLLAVAAGFALTLLVFYPGYVTIDVRYIYADARSWQFGDWQSPAMAVLWGFIDPIAPGLFSMFLAIAMLYWLGFGVLALMAARRSLWLGLVCVLIAF